MRWRTEASAFGILLSSAAASLHREMGAGPDPTTLLDDSRDLALKYSPMKDRIVYSTGIGPRCPNCLRPTAQCVCRKGTPGKGKAGDGVIRVSRETQGRKGKGVTVISGLPLAQEQLEALATQLKRQCGSGGTVDGTRIEIQGDHRDRLVQELTKQGYTVKRAGG